MTTVFITLVSLVGAVIQSATGFGYAIVCMSLWTMLIPLRTASVLEYLSVIIMAIGIAVKFRKHINFRLIIIPISTSIVGSTIGMEILMKNADTSLRRVLGIALILLSIYFMKYKDRIIIKPCLKNSLIFGFISGLCAGIFNIGGPPIVIYYLAATKDKEEYNATLQGYFALSGCYVISKHLLYGNITQEVLRYSMYSIFGVVVGMVIGLMIFNKVSQTRLRKVIYIFMAVMGIWIVVNP